MNIQQHLLTRGVTFNTGITLGDDCAYFWLYNLAGQLLGYQRYNPNGIKTSSPDVEPKHKKYYIWLSDLYFAKGNKASLWGWQFYNPNAKYIILVEGIFDAISAINVGVCAFATLGNDPKILKEQLWLLSQNHTIVTCCDNDKAGNILRKYGDLDVVLTTQYKDLNEAPQNVVNDLLKPYKW